MSEDKQPSGNDSQNPRKPGEASGSFNWRVLILFSVALGLLIIAYMNIGDGSNKPLSYQEFDELMKEHKVIMDSPKHKLEIVTSESSFNATIRGYSVTEPLIIQSESAPREVRVRVNMDLHGKEINELVGRSVRYVKSVDIPATEEEELTIAEFRKLARENRIVLSGSDSCPNRLGCNGSGCRNFRVHCLRRASPIRGSQSIEPQAF